MAINSAGRFSFVRTYSGWQVNEAWRARRRDIAQGYLADGAAMGSALANAWSYQIQGSAALAANAAVARIQAAAKAEATVNLSV